MAKNNFKTKIDASKTNLEVCSILLAAVSLSLKLTDLAQFFSLAKICVTVSMGMTMLFLVAAIVLEADAVFYYSRSKEEWGDYFDKYGYRVMKAGLLFVLIVMNYLASTLFPTLLDTSVQLSELLQAALPAAFALIPYITWRIFKCRKVQCKWYM